MTESCNCHGNENAAVGHTFGVEFKGEPKELGFVVAADAMNVETTELAAKEHNTDITHNSVVPPLAAVELKLKSVRKTGTDGPRNASEIVCTYGRVAPILSLTGLPGVDILYMKML